ncbi:hypothetical protein EYC80_008569 [Monilinia laxa]|uniref:Uncharacterized protein n=1 Tax=Monilinia laxa TaxID=61186 RepID=A0A5N6K135_MONLA|nr:hypothetical protein EYC80_008569 [Monilinia laxa]
MKPLYLLTLICGSLYVQSLLIPTFLATNHADLLKFVVGSHWFGQELDTCIFTSIKSVESGFEAFLRSPDHLPERQLSRSSTQISTEEVAHYHTIDTIPTVIVTTISVQTLSTVILVTPDSIIPSTSTITSIITTSFINLEPNQDDNSHSDENDHNIDSETYNFNKSATRTRNKGTEKTIKEDNATDDAGIDPETSSSRDKEKGKTTEEYNETEGEDTIKSNDTPEIENRHATALLDTPDNLDTGGSSTTKIQTSCKLKEVTSSDDEAFYTEALQLFEGPAPTTQGLTMHPQHSHFLPSLPTHLVLPHPANQITNLYWRSDRHIWHISFDSFGNELIAQALLSRPNYEVRTSLQNELFATDRAISPTGVMAHLAVDPLAILASMSPWGSAIEESGDSQPGEMGPNSESIDGCGHDGSDNEFDNGSVSSSGSSSGSSGGGSGSGSDGYCGDGSEDDSSDSSGSEKEEEEEEEEEEENEEDEEDEALIDDGDEALAEEEENPDEENRDEDQDYGDSDSDPDSNPNSDSDSNSNDD